MEMMSRNLQDDDDHSITRHNELPPADVGDIITAANWIVFDKIFFLTAVYRHSLALESKRAKLL